MSGLIYGKGGKNKGLRRVTCCVCKTRRYVKPSQIERAGDYIDVICRICYESGMTPTPNRPAHTAYSTLSFEDEWRPSYMAFWYVDIDPAQQFMIDAVGWDKLKPVERAQLRLNIARRS